MKSNIFIAEYFIYQLCINIEQGVNIWHLLNQVLLSKVPGDIVELGSLTGMTAAVLQRTIEDAGSNKQLYLYDSFEGLPQPTEEDGECVLNPKAFATGKEYTINRFKEYGLRQPTIVSGWFKDTLPHSLPEAVCFAHLDGDLYNSILISLEAVYPRLSSGAIVVIDDYADDKLLDRIGNMYSCNPYNKNKGRIYKLKDILPGVKRACDRFMADKPEEICVLIAGDERHGFFRKI